MKVVDAIARTLYNAGVRYAFGIPGGEVLHIVEALRQAGIEFILTRHEMGAGFMADAVARLSDGPSVLVATLGPGMTNTVTPVAQAYLDRSPLVVITGAVATSLENIYTHQIIDQQAVLKPITKFSATLRAADAGEVTAKAISLALEGRPGPVHLNLPTDVAQLHHSEAVLPLQRLARPEAIASPRQTIPSEQTVPMRYTVTRPHIVQELLEELLQARKPVALIGLGVANAETSQSVRRFLEKWQIPALTTYKAKGVVAENHPRSLGTIGLSPVVDGIQQSLLHTADLILTIGFDPVELRSDWIPVLQKGIPTINIDVVPTAHRIFKAKHEVLGGIGGILETLTTAREEAGGSALKRWTEDELATHKETWQSCVLRSGTDTLHPYDVLKIMREELPEDTLACVDTGAHRILANHVWECYEVNGLLQSNGLGTMAYALPAAIGTQLMHRDRTVLCLTGDAGFDMITGEMALLAKHQLSPIIVIFSDRALSLIKLKQERMHLPQYGVDFDIPSYTKLAEAYGGRGYQVGHPEQLRSLLQELKQEHAPRPFVLIEAQIDPSDYSFQM